MITTNIEKCPICRSDNSIKTDFTYGQVVCTNCGTVLDERIIDETSEWRNFSSENPGSSNNDPNRVGGPINPYMDETNLSTTIHSKSRNSVLSKWSHRSIGNGSRSLNRIFKRIEDLAGKLDLQTSIVEKTKDLIIQVEKEKKLKGRSLDCIIASVFFVACRRCNAPRTLKDLIQGLQLDKKDVARCFNCIKETISDNTQEHRIAINTIGLVQNYCNKLEINNTTKKLASEIADEVCKQEIIAGRNPATVATASIYFALKLLDITTTTKKDIAEQSKTTENTINSAYQELLSYKNVIVPASYKEHLVNLEKNS